MEAIINKVRQKLDSDKHFNHVTICAFWLARCQQIEPTGFDEVSVSCWRDSER